MSRTTALICTNAFRWTLLTQVCAEHNLTEKYVLYKNFHVVGSKRSTYLRSTSITALCVCLWLPV